MTKEQEALKLALEALEAIHTHADVACVVTPDGAVYLQPAITAIKEVLAQPAQEPVAYMSPNEDEFCTVEDAGTYIPKTWLALYPTPPQRPWVGLTEEEIVSINDQHYNIAFRDFDADVAIARAIGVKLKEKNT